MEFQSTLLMRGATGPAALLQDSHQISIHAPHARSDLAGSSADAVSDISIHAPHARSDVNMFLRSSVDAISIHAPHARSDNTLVDMLDSIGYISIHAPHARSDHRVIKCQLKNSLISIHAPHARSDIQWSVSRLSICYFNPRSSCEERLPARLLPDDNH